MDRFESLELNDAELEAVAGGLDCNAAVAIGWIYTITAMALNALGDKVGAAQFLGKSQGILQGACPT